MGLGLIIIIVLLVAIFIVKKFCCHCKEKHTRTLSIEIHPPGNHITIEPQDENPAITESAIEGVQDETENHLTIAASNPIPPYVHMLQAPPSCPSSYVLGPHAHPPSSSPYVEVSYTPPMCPSIYAPVPQPPPRAMIVFSPNSPEEEEKCILQFLVRDLRNRDIETSCHVLQSPRGSLANWVIREFEGAVAILCVCNSSLYQEWEGQNSGRECCVVHALKQLVHGAITHGQDISCKIAVIKLFQSHFIYIPSILQSCRDYMVSDTDGIAKFVKEQPPYSLTQ